MAVTEREVLDQVIRMLESDGLLRNMTGAAQVVVAKARTLLAVRALPAAKSTIRCDTWRCPSRLEFEGDMTEEQAAEAARKRMWSVVAGVHHCPSCRKEP